MLRLVYAALRSLPRPERPITVIYCDTRVEIPSISRGVRATLRALKAEARVDGLPIRVQIARPPVEDSFFVKVAGRGYPPPTNKFRWCTDRLRIRPVRQVIAQQNDTAVVVLGTRLQESEQRKRTLTARRLRGDYVYRQAGSSSTEVFAPIVHFDIADVWATLHRLSKPHCIDTAALVRLYRDADTECSIMQDPRGAPCGSGRFGCWTCTVVRRDKAVGSLVKEGYHDLQPLKEFRDWLYRMRDMPENRCRFRRNGAVGPGPLTLAARKLILRRLRGVQARVPWTLITAREIHEIHRLWRADRLSARYAE